MKHFLVRGWPWMAGSALVLLGAVVVVVWMARPGDAQADYQITQVHLTADMVAMGTASATGTPLATTRMILTAPTGTAGSSADRTSTPPSALEKNRPILQATSQPTSDDPPAANQVCDQAVAGNPMDVTVPDEAQFLPGQVFTKIWRLQNAGSCTWSKEYSARFFFGDQMSAPEIVYLDKDVSPGAAIEIAVDMVAPSEPGSYQGNWKLSNADGTLFGIGPRSDAPFWVRIMVLRIFTPTPTDTPTATPTSTLAVSLTPTSPPTAPVHISGNLVLRLAQKLDLDTGQVDLATGFDVAYLLEGGFHLLAPQSNALLGVYGSQEPERDLCILSTMSSASIALESLSPGAYMCFQTSEGLPGWLRFEALDSQNGSASLAFNTWELP